jgi:hypothetical protein
MTPLHLLSISISLKTTMLLITDKEPPLRGRKRDEPKTNQAIWRLSTEFPKFVFTIPQRKRLVSIR